MIIDTLWNVGMVCLAGGAFIMSFGLLLVIGLVLFAGGIR